MDGSGWLDENELLTLASMAKGREPDPADLDEMRLCLSEAARAIHAERKQEEHQQEEEQRKAAAAGRSSLLAAVLEGWRGWVVAGRRSGRSKGGGGPVMDLQALVNCPVAVEGLRLHFKARLVTYESVHALGPHVAFEMVGDDLNKTRDQLASIRARRTKFVCVNDDMRDPTPAHARLLRDFYLSFFPRPSRFELRGGRVNTSTHLGALGRAQGLWRLAALVALLLLLGWAASALEPLAWDDDDRVVARAEALLQAGCAEEPEASRARRLWRGLKRVVRGEAKAE